MIHKVLWNLKNEHVFIDIIMKHFCKSLRRPKKMMFL